jgi:opacity protein-like surface antigen
MIKKALGLSALLLGLSVASFGQSFEGAVSGGLSKLSGKDIGSGYSLDDGFRIAFRITLNTRKYLGYEFGYAYNHTHLLLAGVDQGGMAIHQGFGGALLYATKEGARFRPFVTGGLHFSNFVPPGASAQYGQGDNKFGFNYGAGLKVRILGPWQMRFDARQYNQSKPFELPGVSGRLLLNEFSAGIGFQL